MSGSHDFLASSAKEFVEPHLQKSMYDAVWFLLSNQYVGLDGLPSAWRVKVGSGMGSHASGEIADAAFIAGVERKLLRGNTLEQAGIKFYGRCKDDIFIIKQRGRGLPLINRVFAHENRTGFKVKRWDVSSQTCEVLDAYFYKPDDVAVRRRLGARVHWKATSLGVPLSPSSAHNPSIHLAWKLGQIRRCAEICSDRTNFTVSKNTFVDNLKKNFVDEKTQSTLESFDPYTERQIRFACGANRIIQPVEQPSGTLWFVLKFHPLWKAASIERILNHTLNKGWWKRTLDNAWMPVAQPWNRIRLSWRLGGKSLDATLSRSRRCMGMEGG